MHGEIATSAFLGYANKAHDGFVGHSVVGHWVNLGALTTTSNLKNTYGPVRLVVGDRRIDTGRQYLGTLFGDHAKTAIGTMLGTGTVVGTGANVFGAAPPKHVPGVRVGQRQWRATHGRRLPPDSRAGVAAARARADAGVAPVARAHVRPGNQRMMRLYVLGSGSRGNCCAVEAEGSALLLDAGFSAREVERRAEVAGLDLARVVGIALTHEHGDHACGAARLARRLGAPVLTAAARGTLAPRIGAGPATPAIGMPRTLELDPPPGGVPATDVTPLPPACAGHCRRRLTAGHRSSPTI